MLPLLWAVFIGKHLPSSQAMNRGSFVGAYLQMIRNVNPLKDCGSSSGLTFIQRHLSSSLSLVISSPPRPCTYQCNAELMNSYRYLTYGQSGKIIQQIESRHRKMAFTPRSDDDDDNKRRNGLSSLSWATPTYIFRFRKSKWGTANKT